MAKIVISFDEDFELKINKQDGTKYIEWNDIKNSIDECYDNENILKMCADLLGKIVNINEPIAIKMLNIIQNKIARDYAQTRGDSDCHIIEGLKKSISQYF